MERSKQGSKNWMEKETPFGKDFLVSAFYRIKRRKNIIGSCSKGINRLNSNRCGQPRSQGLSSYRSRRMRDPGKEVAVWVDTAVFS